jgi:hypothetical protein
MGMPNVIMETAIMTLPMPCLFGVRTPWRQKLVAVVLLGMGIVYVCTIDNHWLHYADTIPRTWAQKILWDLDFLEIARTPDCIFGIILSGSLFFKRQPSSARNVRCHEDNLIEGAHWQQEKRETVAKSPKLLYPPSWFANEDGGTEAELQAVNLVHVATGETCCKTWRFPQLKHFPRICHGKERMTGTRCRELNPMHGLLLDALSLSRLG